MTSLVPEDCQAVEAIVPHIHAFNLKAQAPNVYFQVFTRLCSKKAENSSICARGGGGVI